MVYLERINYRVSPEILTEKEQNALNGRFDAYGAELVINGLAIRWEGIDEVEVAVAARISGFTGWIVKNLIMGGERYHVGVYYGGNEAVLPNVTLNMAKFVVQTIAYYVPQPVRYKGPEGISPLRER